MLKCRIISRKAYKKPNSWTMLNYQGNIGIVVKFTGFIKWNRIHPTHNNEKKYLDLRPYNDILFSISDKLKSHPQNWFLVKILTSIRKESITRFSIDSNNKSHSYSKQSIQYVDHHLLHISYHHMRLHPIRVEHWTLAVTRSKYQYPDHNVHYS